MDGGLHSQPQSSDTDHHENDDEIDSDARQGTGNLRYCDER